MEKEAIGHASRGRERVNKGQADSRAHKYYIPPAHIRCRWRSPPFSVNRNIYIPTPPSMFNEAETEAEPSGKE